MEALTISPRDTRPRRRPAGSVTATRLMDFWVSNAAMSLTGVSGATVTAGEFMRSPARAHSMGRAMQPLVIRQFATRLMKFLAS